MPTRTHASHRSALALATAFILPALASAQVLHTWSFDDPVGTALNASASAGGIFFNTPVAGVATNGSGSLVIAYNSASSTRSFADIPDVGTGILQLDVLVAGWDLSGVTADPDFGPLVEFGFANATGSSNGTTRTALIQFAADNTGSDIVGVAGGTGAAGTAGNIVFGKTQATPVTFRLVANFDADTYVVSSSADNFSTVTGGTLAADRGANFILIRALDNFTVGGGSFTVDRITVTAIPEPAAATVLLGIAALGLAGVTRRRR